MTEGDGLSALKMRIAGHYGIDILLGYTVDNAYKSEKKTDNLIRLFTQIESDVKRNLVVTAARSVKPFSRVADTLCQFGLNEHMNILGVTRKSELSAFYIRKYFAE